VIYARFEGGPFGGEMMALAGESPRYMLLIDGAQIGWSVPIVVGADFDDHWPGQERYELTDIYVGGSGPATAIYTHEPTTPHDTAA
jgi:hypothetical protein